MKIDLHVHTEYSSDCRIKIGQLIAAVMKTHLDGIAITDHNGIDGALAVRKTAHFVVIIGEEIETADGEIIGLFLIQKINPGLTLLDTIQSIKEQGGLVLVPHPFDHLRSSAIKTETLVNLIEHIDIIEAFNARNVFQKDNDLAQQFALNNRKAVAAGSDAHTQSEIGNAYVDINRFTGPADFLTNLDSATLTENKSSLAYHLVTKTIKLFGRQ
jgi:predicted metal-dependent phosphoesterase TrpH